MRTRTPTPPVDIDIQAANIPGHYNVVLTAPGSGVNIGRASVEYWEHFPLIELNASDNPYDTIDIYYVAHLDIWPQFQGRGYGRAAVRAIEEHFGANHTVVAISTDTSDGFWRSTGWRRNVDTSTNNMVYSFNLNPPQERPHP